MKYRYHHLHLMCSNLNEMINFFTEIFGAELVARRKFRTADGATLDLDGTTINIRGVEEGEEVLGDESRPHYGYHHLALQVEDLDAAYSELVEKGLTFTAPPAELGTVKYTFLKGPDGITIELVQPS